VYSVEAEGEALEGVAAYRSLAELPAPPDLVLLCGAPASVPELVSACVELGVAGVWVLAGGPAAVDRGGAALGRMVAQQAASRGGLRVLGAS
jgi:acetyltransferase